MWSSFLSLAAISTQAQNTEEFPKIKFGGDFRFRHEHAEKQGAAVSTYEHQRIRVRVGTVIRTDETTQLEFRLATGNGRTSTNQSLGKTTLHLATPLKVLQIIVFYWSRQLKTRSN